MAFFRCYQDAVHRTFVIEVPSRQRIGEARKIINGSEKLKIHVMGTIIKKPKAYNAPWRWHLDPRTIEFFEFAMEVCDASVVDVQKRLKDVGGDFLPNRFWCPWGSKVIEEIPELGKSRGA